MITDKDREELIEDLRAYNDAWVLEEGKDRDRLIEFESAIRAESAEQARKEAAERICKRCLKNTPCEKNCCTVSTILVDFSTDHIVDTNKKADHIPDTGKKLAIAVKALENIIAGNDLACERGESMASWMDSDFRRQAKDALKEIQE